MPLKKADIAYGIVLEGGGAKGAYQIGVWQALRELDINIKGVVGTSVGALNGALICMDAFDEALHIWQDISYSKVMDVKDEIIESVKTFDLKTIDYKGLLKDVKKMIVNGGVDITPLKELVKELLDEERMRKSSIEFGLVTVSLTDLKSIEVFIKDIPKGQIIDFLIASSYLPVFKKEKINGKRYLDGGFYDNIPANMLINKGYKNLIIVRVYGIGIERRLRIKEDMNVIVIAPKEDLGGLLDFSQKRCQYNMQLGYYDALKVFKDLKGNDYYIEMKHKDDYYMARLAQLPNGLKERFVEVLKIDKPYQRAMFESILPKLAKILGLDKAWNYQEFIAQLLEFMAIRLKLPRFHAYTDDELLLKLKEKVAIYEKKHLLSYETKQLRELLLLVIKYL